MEPRDDGLDLAVRLTLAHGGDLLAVERRRDLDPVDGIGAAAIASASSARLGRVDRAAQLFADLGGLQRLGLLGDGRELG